MRKSSVHLFDCVVPLGHGIYFLVTGIWPLLSIGTFQRVTGPKTDLWLVKIVGVLITVIGAVIAVAGIRNQITPEIKSLAVASAAGLAGIDTVYATRGRISPIYLADAVAELCLILVWLFVRTNGRRQGSGAPLGKVVEARR